MHLTTFSDYSMRVLMYLGLQHEQLVTIGHVAQVYQVSENHLTKVVHKLALRDYIKTVRGKGGGMRLACAEDQINIGEVIRYTEGDRGLLPCLDNESDCRIQPACKLIGVLRESQEAMYLVLDKYTLADLLVEENALTKILLP